MTSAKLQRKQLRHTRRSPQITLVKRHWKMTRNRWFLPRRFARLRNINVTTARGVSSPKLLWENTNTLVKNSRANTARKRMCPWERWKCTSARIHCRVNARFVGKHSAVRGYYRVTFARTREKSHINAPTASEPSPTALTYERTCKHTLRWKNTVVIIARDLFQGCRFYSSTSIHVEKDWTSLREFSSLNYHCYLNNSVVDILNFVRYQCSFDRASYFICRKIMVFFFGLLDKLSYVLT